MTFSSTAGNKSTFFFDEASSIVEANLHALFENLANLDHVLCYCWYMQNVLDVDLVAFFPKWDIADMLNGVNCVIPSFQIVGSFGPY